MEISHSINCELVSTENLGCSMCYTISEEFQSSVVGATRMLPWKVVKSIIDESAEIGVKSISFSWRGSSHFIELKMKWKSYKVSRCIKICKKKKF